LNREEQPSLQPTTMPNRQLDRPGNCVLFKFKRREFVSIRAHVLHQSLRARIFQRFGSCVSKIKAILP